LCLTLIVTALVTRQYRSTIESNAITTTRSLISNTATIGYHFGFIFTSIILVETTFNVGGFGSYFLNAIMVGDFFVIVAFVNMIIIFFAITSIISNIIFSVRESEQFISPGSFDETYPHLKWKSPFTIIGLIIISFFIIVALYPEIISQYSLTELKSSFPGQWELPSSDHLLGQGTSGRDMLGQIVWGVSFCILVGMGAVVIGILGGLLFGLTATKLSERGKNLVTGFTLVIYIIPSAILVFLIALIFGSNFIMTMIFIGIVLIPSFTRITANASTLEINVFKSILKYLPLMVGIAMILFESINFLGFSDTRIITLGQLVNEGRLQLYYYFGFAIFPAIAIILMVTGLILLYEGL
jgi:peptide/nickel transport system permease protein